MLQGMTFGLAVAMLVATASGAQARCSSTPFRFGEGVTQATAQWAVEKGTPCAGRLSTFGLTALSKLSIARQAAHGVAGVASRFQFAYNPDPNFVGRDSFVARIDFDHRGAPGTTLVTVEVTVR